MKTVLDATAVVVSLDSGVTSDTDQQREQEEED